MRHFTTASALFASAEPTELPLDALEAALWIRETAGHTAQGRLAG